MQCKCVSLKDWRNKLAFAWDGINGTDTESVRGLSSHWHTHTIIFLSPLLPNTPLFPAFHALLPSPSSPSPSFTSLLPYNKLKRALWRGGRTGKRNKPRLGRRGGRCKTRRTATRDNHKNQKAPTRQHPRKYGEDVRGRWYRSQYYVARPAHLLWSHTCIKLHACSAELYKRMRVPTSLVLHSTLIARCVHGGAISLL